MDLRTKIICYLGVYTIAIVVGFLLVGAAVHAMRLTCGIKRKSFKWIDFWMGGTERAVALTLVLLAPLYLPAFVGGWIGLKFAANWKRHELAPKKRQSATASEDIDEQVNVDNNITHSSLLSLVGNAYFHLRSIALGLLFNPTAIATWNK